MSLKIKCEQNYESAKTLIGNDYFAPSVHCSYYSCVQYILLVFLEKYGWSKDDLTRRFIKWKIKVRKGQKNKGSDANREKRRETGIHNYYIHMMYVKLCEKDAIDCDAFNESITRLKGLRLKSDYSNNAILKTDASNGVDTADQTLKLLQKHFSL